MDEDAKPLTQIRDHINHSLPECALILGEYGFVLPPLFISLISTVMLPHANQLKADDKLLTIIGCKKLVCLSAS